MSDSARDAPRASARDARDARDAHSDASTDGAHSPHSDASTDGAHSPHSDASTDGAHSPHSDASTDGAHSPHSAHSTDGAHSTADVIMVIRHGEKPTAPGETGFAADGTPHHDALTIRGWQRAGALVALFDPAEGRLCRGLRRPDRIYAAKAEPAGRHLREEETVSPLAAKLGLRVHSHHPVPDIARVAAEIAPLPGATLVCWEHKVLPSIVDGLGAVHPTPPAAWPGERFDVVWVFTRRGAGWDFTQVPQLLLAGDSPDPIA